MALEPSIRTPPVALPLGVAAPGNGEGAVGLRSTSTIVGLHFQSVSPSAMAFAGSAPIAGKVQLEGIIAVVDIVSAGEDPHRVQLALASDVPTTQAELDAAEQMFPRASQASDSRFSFIVSGKGGQAFFPIGTALVLNGRRIVGGFYNGHATSPEDVYVGLILHRVTGGESAGDPGFLTGEEVVPG